MGFVSRVTILITLIWGLITPLITTTTFQVRFKGAEFVPEGLQGAFSSD